MNLTGVRNILTAHLESLRDRDGPAGSYRGGRGRRTDLYASLDVAIMRTLMGDDLRLSLAAAERLGWADHINSFQKPDGTFTDVFTHHSQLHAHGMVIGALGALGERMRYPHSLYTPLIPVDQVGTWLRQIDWAAQWSASHLFWGGMHCYSMSATCPDEWKQAVFTWLDDHLDRDTGWWVRGIPHTDRHQALGGCAHILPIYQHHHHPFPAPERLIDSVLAMQLPDARWLDDPGHYPVSYLELDALYTLKFTGDLAPHHRGGEIRDAVRRFGQTVEAAWNSRRPELLAEHPHILLGLVGTFGPLQQHLPDEFTDTAKWTDIFSDRRLYQTDVTTASSV
ncbi:MAG: hypothetical protein K9M98_06035 [Cephaloticoccus sp.]|nr:hypothetical protein [Cephaloticoccus sp.]MCF7760044.1 hypothetical protein [Cephaloticoccus sp.]